jgi:distribution and morphology protein 10
MFSLQHDTGRWCSEYTYSAEDSMLGVRMLHNFGKLAPSSGSDESATSRGGGGMTKMKRIDEEDAMEGGLKGRISAGAEIYFSAKEKSAGGHTPTPSVYETKSLTYPTYVRQCRWVSGSPLSQTQRRTHQSQSRQRHRLRLPLLLTHSPLPESPNLQPPSPHFSTP